MKIRYRVLVWACVLLIAYVAAAIAAWRIMPAKIAEAERKRVGVTMALAKVANDQLAVSRRISEITKKTLGNGQDKAAQVTMLLGDDELNRFALTYMGADWATMYSSFVGSVKHARDMLKASQPGRENAAGKIEERKRDLEIRKRQLMRGMEAPHDQAHLQKQRQWQAELNDIDRQLAECRNDSAYRARFKKDSLAESDNAARCKEKVYGLATDYEAQTVGKLVQAMSDKAEALKYEEAEPARMRQRMAAFDIWPLNKCAARPLGIEE